jgi:folate-binding protein YgfZ
VALHPCYRSASTSATTGDQGRSATFHPEGTAAADGYACTMATHTPLKPSHIEGGAMLRAYGPEEAGIELVEAFDYVEAEYAAIRKHAGVFDQPHRGTLEITGPERLAFLHRMITQDVKGMQPGEVKRGFWLSRKGRIEADLRLLELGDRMLVDLDAHNAAGAAESLGAYIITEDVQITYATERWHRLSVHGPAARALVARHCADDSAVMRLEPDRAVRVELLGQEAIIDRQDITGEVGLELLVPTDHAATVYRALAAPHDPATRLEGRGYQPDPEGRARRIGWHAMNIARIEAGTPVYNIDFGPSNLPHETGVLRDRVSFTKGCYLGQEIVARLDALGNPKQKLVGLKIEDPEGAARDGARVPPSGAPVFIETAPEKRDLVGAVTSSTIAPLVGGVPVAFAMVKFKHATPGTRVLVEAEGGALLGAEVREGLRFLK